ncbi:MAG: hypothetical protein IPK79_07025 [Vampirovibrionales bacterium]|nr:hypothetical protein [Vampirovibrionales bacterium]
MSIGYGGYPQQGSNPAQALMNTPAYASYNANMYQSRQSANAQIAALDQKYGDLFQSGYSMSPMASAMAQSSLQGIALEQQTGQMVNVGSGGMAMLNSAIGYMNGDASQLGNIANTQWKLATPPPPPPPPPVYQPPAYYPPQQPAYPPQAYYPQQQPPAYYPPQQPAYPPQAYYPQQPPAYYPPQQPSYPPQQAYYPQQQPPAYYPPQQQAYPPQQAYYPQQPPAYYPPQQPSYPPQQPKPPASSPAPSANGGDLAALFGGMSEAQLKSMLSSIMDQMLGSSKPTATASK